MKTIGYVLADFPVFSETFVGDEMRAVARAGHRVVPIVMNLRDGPAQDEDRTLALSAQLPSREPGLPSLVERLRGGPGLRALAFAARQRRLPARSLLWNAMKIAAIAHRSGCAHLHAHFSGGAAAHAIVAARMAGLSVSFVCHGHDVYSEAEDLPLKLRSADFAVAVCNDMASDLRAMAPSARIVEMACGVDDSALAPRAGAASNGRLLFIGRLVEQKGIDDLLVALSGAPAAEIDVVGEGPLAGEYARQAARLGVAERVHFLGSRPKEWLRSHAPAYMGLVAPFKIAPDGARDTGPLVVKEAMAMGLPIVSTRFMGVKETVSPETGILTEPGDPGALAQSIRTLLAMSQEERNAMGERGRARVRDLFTQRRQAERLSSAFEAA